MKKINILQLSGKNWIFYDFRAKIGYYTIYLKKMQEINIIQFSGKNNAKNGYFTIFWQKRNISQFSCKNLIFYNYLEK